MLYQTQLGAILDDDALNKLSAMEIEELGIHAREPLGSYLEES